MSNLDFDTQSKTSRILPPLEKNAVIAGLINSPASVRSHTMEEDEHHTRLGEHAAVLWKFNKITDVTVKLNDEKYPAHKTVLSCYSRYFKSFLLKSKKDVSVIDLPLKEVTNDAFSVLLRYMYTADLELTCQNIGDVYIAARKLGVDGAIDACAKILKGEERHEVHSVYAFVTARKLGAQDEASQALRKMCRRFEHIAGTQEFLDLNCDQVVEYLSQDALATRSEVVVFLSALKWLHVLYLDREQYCVRVVSCVRFPMMTLKEVLACHSPPLLPGVLELPEIQHMLLTATCFISAKTLNEEKRFQRYNCNERKYLIDREPMILWDTNIFDPDHHALYSKEVAASTIQASFRDFKAKKEKEDRDYRTEKEREKQEEAAEVIQKAYRRRFGHQDSGHQESDHEDYVNEDSSRIVDDEEQNSGGIIAPLAKMFRRSVTGLFGRSNVPEESVENLMKEKTRRQREKTPKTSEYDRQPLRNASKPRKRRSPNWEVPYEKSSIVVDLEERNLNDSNDFEKDSYAPISEKYFKQMRDSNSTSDQRNHKSKKHLNQKHVEESIAELAKSVYDKGEDTYGAIVISGGFNTDDTASPDSGKLLLAYKPALGEWCKLEEMYKPRHHHRLVYLKGFIYCIGGCNPERTRRKEKMVPLKSCYAFDFSSKTWTRTADMRHCRVYHATAVLNGNIYVVGGKDEKDCMLSSVEVYDPESDYWTELYDSLDCPTIGAGVCSRDDKLWVIGGMFQDHKGKIEVSRSVKCYDHRTQEWRSDVIPSLPSPRAFVGAAVCGGRVYVVGGSSHAGPTGKISSFGDVYFYDDDGKEWRDVAPLPSPRHFVGALVVFKSLFVLGGLTSFHKGAIDDILIFNEEENCWVQTSRIPVSLCGFATVEVPNLMLDD